MEPIDSAFQAFKNLSREVGEYIHSVITETDTRMKVIDRVFVEVLGWPHFELLTETHTEAGYADYSLLGDGFCRGVVEAKRDGRSLGCESRAGGRAYKLDGPVFRDGNAQEGIRQAISYCAEQGAELACVTNGREWIIFRANRLGDGIPVRQGQAFVFPNLGEIETGFQRFYQLLSRESVLSRGFMPEFQEAEGRPIRMSVFNKPVRPQGSAHAVAQSRLAADMEKVMSTFFRRLTGDEDPQLIEACFVESDDSRNAERQLTRIAESMSNRIRDLETGTGTQLVELIQRTAESRRHEFVVIVGQKGSGKSTFVARFFKLVLPEALRQQCTVLQVDLADNPGSPQTLVDWLDRAFVARAEASLFEGAPTFKELKGAFYDEYTRLKKGPWANLYTDDRTAFLHRFGDHIEAMRDQRPHTYLEGLIRSVVGGRRQVPVLVFDNTDHFDIEFQQRVYQYAQSLYERTFCLVIVPITDRTSWQLTKHGAIQSFEHESFFLPTPGTQQILRKRVEFLESKIDSERDGGGKYFTDRGVSLTVRDLQAFTKALQKLFLQSATTAEWIGALANYEIRRALNVANQFIVSPHLRVEDLVGAYLAHTSINVESNVVERALIRGRYDIYPQGMHDSVQNLYALEVAVETTPLLGVRLLQALADVPTVEREGAFIEVENLMAVATTMSIEARATRMWMDRLLKTGLILNYDPTVLDVDAASRVEISPAGALHLSWARSSFEYLVAMSVTTALLDEVRHAEIKAAFDRRQYRTMAASFAEYLVSEDALFCVVPDHSTYSSQSRVRGGLADSATRWRVTRPRPARLRG